MRFSNNTENPFSQPSFQTLQSFCSPPFRFLCVIAFLVTSIQIFRCISRFLLYEVFLYIHIHIYEVLNDIHLVFFGHLSLPIRHTSPYRLHLIESIVSFILIFIPSPTSSFITLSCSVSGQYIFQYPISMAYPRVL